MDDFNLDAIRNQIKSSGALECYLAIRTAIDAIPDSAPLLEDPYATYVSTESAPCSSAAYAAIRRHKSIAVPFLLRLLESSRTYDRQNEIHLLLGLGHNRYSWRIAGQILDDRPDSQPAWNAQQKIVVQKLYLAIADSDSDVQTLAAIALDDIGETPELIVETIMNGLKSDKIHIRNLAALHLGRLGAVATSALPALAKFVQSNTDTTDGIHRPVLAAQNAINRINGT